MRFSLHNSCQPTDRGRGPQFSYRRSYFVWLTLWRDRIITLQPLELKLLQVVSILDKSIPVAKQWRGKHEDSWQGLAAFWSLNADTHCGLTSQVSGLNIPAAEQRVSGLVMLSLHTWHLTAPRHTIKLWTRAADDPSVSQSVFGFHIISHLRHYAKQSLYQR